MFLLLLRPKRKKEAKKKADRELKLEMGKDLFESVYTAFSSKKISTVTLKDGRIIQGYKTGIKQKSGLILSIEIEDSISKKKEKFTAEQISEMYLYPSGFQKSLKMQSFFGNVNNYGRKSLNKIVSQGYIYIKNQEVSIKNKKEKKEYLMQLINPEFSSIIEVYGDPMAKETGGVSFGGGPTIGGGVTKSYYVKKGDKVYWLEKKDFNDY
ncbi:hypothetical protein [Apibacter sp. HY039]|uniref:hypothetical protein n=1 Tax=Apibacter sp. HY039 TaxID=2501476 RepID=UPI000FEB66D3|nr:hypothetical protein [Apibacter sp. HY039]